MTGQNLTPDALLAELQAIPKVEDRIRLVAKDVHSKVDRYRSVDPFDLAEALGAPHPQNLGDWSRYTAVEIEPLEQALDDRGSGLSDDIGVLLGKVSEKRFDKLVAALDKGEKVAISLLSKRERKALEKAFAEDVLQNHLENGIGGIATCTVGSGRSKLSFEGDIEDDGIIIYLRTPYDARDGRFQNFDNCVMESY